MTSHLTDPDPSAVENSALDEAPAQPREDAGTRRAMLRRWTGLGAIGAAALVTAACTPESSGKGSGTTPPGGATGAPGTGGATPSGSSAPTSGDPAPSADGTTPSSAGPSDGAPAPDVGAPGMDPAGATVTPVVDPDSPVDTAPTPGMPEEPPAPSGDAPQDPPRDSGDGTTPGTDPYTPAPASPTVEKEAELAPGVVLRTTPEWHLARRAAHAPTAEMVEKIRSMGIPAWIDQQLNPGSIDDAAADGLVSQNFPWAVSSATKVRSEAGEFAFRAAAQVSNALLWRGRTTNRVLHESVVEVLSDHVYVPVFGKAEIFSPEYDAILREHAFGTYSELLHALITNPALLIQLDNQQNHGKEPNENLGRELLELYTVGRDTYSEDDVVGSTHILTGHGLDWEKLAYRYDPADHRVGPVAVLGFKDANADAAKGEDLLRRYIDYLAHHESTAQRLAHRFAVRFISDAPSEKVVADLAKTYLDNDTSIAELTRATLTHPEFSASVGKKWRRPFEHVMWMARSARVTAPKPRGRIATENLYDSGLYGWLVSRASHFPRKWPAVDGYPDTADYWMSSSVLMSMWNNAQVAVIGDQTENGGAELQWAPLLAVQPGADARETAVRITGHLTGYTWADADVEQVAATLASGLEQPYAPGQTVSEDRLEERTRQAVRLTFASPYGCLR